MGFYKKSFKGLEFVTAKNKIIRFKKNEFFYIQVLLGEEKIKPKTSNVWINALNQLSYKTLVKIIILK